MSSSKPISIILSASSRARYRQISRLTIFLLSRSIRRPGVATIMCTPLQNATLRSDYVVLNSSARMHAFIMLWFIHLQRTAVVNVHWLCKIKCFSGQTLTAWSPPSALWQTCRRCRGQCAAEAHFHPPGACSSTRWCRVSVSPAPSTGEQRHSNSHA